MLESPKVPSVKELKELTTTLRRSCDRSLEVLDNMLIYELKTQSEDPVLFVKEALSS
jgi:hypothetical protein